MNRITAVATAQRAEEFAGITAPALVTLILHGGARVTANLIPAGAGFEVVGPFIARRPLVATEFGFAYNGSGELDALIDYVKILGPAQELANDYTGVVPTEASPATLAELLELLSA